jgi:hypothetical protein
MHASLFLGLLISSTLAAPLPVPQDTTCVASTLNIGTCDSDSGNVNLDVPVDVSPTVDLSDILVRAPVAAPEPEPVAAPKPQTSTCVASTLNVGTCDDGSGNVSVDAPVTVDPSISL